MEEQCLWYYIRKGVLNGLIEEWNMSYSSQLKDGIRCRERDESHCCHQVPDSTV